MSFGIATALILVFLYFAGAFYGGFYDGLGTDVSALEAIMQFDIFRDAEVDLFITSFRFPIPNFAYFGAWGDLLTWNSSLWTGWASYVRVAFLGGITAGVVLSLLIALFSGFLSRQRP